MRSPSTEIYATLGFTYLDSIDVPETPDRKVRGYTVKVKYQALGEEQQQARKQAIADVIVKSMKRMKGV